MGILDKIKEKISGELPSILRDDMYTLIIGLGGSGKKFAAATKKLLIERHGLERVKGRVNFLCLDTEDLNRPEGLSDNEFMLLQDFNLTPWRKSWLNPDILGRLERGELRPTDPGAAGVRMLGRLKLFSTEAFIIEKLTPIIGNYSANRLPGLKINVFVMASICGGTGCGAFIDIPYFIKKVFHDDGGIPFGDVYYYGMFELPDSKIHSIPEGERDPVDEKKAYSNAYAAMKDLEYYQRGDTVYAAEFQRGGMYSDSTRAYDTCFFLSNNATDRSGGRLNRNSLDYSSIYLEGAIPEAVNLIISSWDHIDADGIRRKFTDDNGRTIDFEYKAKESNVQGQGIRQNAFNQEQIVSTFGVSKIESPKEKIILAVISRVFLGLQTRWEKIVDGVLINKILNEDIQGIFNVDRNLNVLLDILDLNSLDWNSLRERDGSVENFARQISNKLATLTQEEAYIKEVDHIKKELVRKIEGIYKIHGPFVALKIFERAVYGELVNQLMRINRPSEYLKKTLFGKVQNYRDIISKWGRTKEKELLLLEAKDAADKYAKYHVFLEWEKEIEKIKKFINDEYHSKLFDRVRKMVTDMRVIFKEITNIDNYTEELRTDTSVIFSWDFSDVKWSAVFDKVNSLFGRKITYRDPIHDRESRTVFTRSKVVNTADRNKEIFYWDKSQGIINVVEYIDDATGRTVEIQNVASIEEAMRFGNEEMPNTASNVVSIEEMIKNFLLDVKNKPVSRVDDLIVDNFAGIINKISGMNFADMVILSSEGVDFSKQVTELTDERKKNLFETATKNKFIIRTMPSFPVSANYVAGQLDTRHYSVMLKPKLDTLYENVLADSQNNVVTKGKTIPLEIKGLSTMLAVNFYFDYSLNAYWKIKECKEEYEGALKTNDKIGIHIAEGEGVNGFDIRKQNLKDFLP